MKKAYEANTAIIVRFQVAAESADENARKLLFTTDIALLHSDTTQVMAFSALCHQPTGLPGNGAYKSF